MAYNVVIAADFGSANTGLTVYGKLFGTNGSQVGSTITSGFAEAVAGLYVYVLAAPDSQEGVFVAYDSANTALRRVAVIAPRETENPDVKTSTRGTSTLTTGDIDARLAAYDAPTKAELDSAVSPLATQTSVDTLAGYVDTEVASILAAVDTEISAIKAKTDNLPASPAATTDIPGTAAIAAAIFAVAVETGHDLTTVLRAIYAAIRGRSVADDADDPTTVTYYAPDNSTARVTHTLTDTERTVA